MPREYLFALCVATNLDTRRDIARVSDKLFGERKELMSHGLKVRIKLTKDHKTFCLVTKGRMGSLLSDLSLFRNVVQFEAATPYIQYLEVPTLYASDVG